MIPLSVWAASKAVTRIEAENNEKALTVFLRKYAATSPEFAVAAVDNRTGRTYSYNGDTPFVTASAVKVDILAAVLLTTQAQNRELDATERSLAEKMIRASDNGAATALYTRIGDVAGLTAANARIGLKHTEVNHAWGLTRTTALDQSRLLRIFTHQPSIIKPTGRGLARTLMGSVNLDQSWGVSAAAKPGEKVVVKNGWDSQDSEQGRWVVNSIGNIAGKKADISIVVLTHGNDNLKTGIAQVEKISQKVRSYLNP